MPLIRQLPPHVVNQIAAGEVIERPASVVKELMENAIDAGASRIDVSIDKGGLELIRVCDNGCGIPADQLTLALASHATSKLAGADDLFRVGTLGFRGEALASIASVSRLLLCTRTSDDTSGMEIESLGGSLQPAMPCGAPLGTTLEVRQLFFNTPVRRKFLRTTQTEFSHIAEAFTKLALAYPQIHFTLRHNDRIIHDLPPIDDWRERIAAFFEPELASSLIPVESSDGPVRLQGFAANPMHSRAQPRMQYLFLNGRAIRDRSLQHALSEAYRGLLLTGRYPIVFLRIEMPADWVDVNVHPTKMEVRFADSGRLYSQLLGALRNTFLMSDLTARVAPVEEASPAHGLDPNRAESLRQELVEWAQGQLALAPSQGQDFAAHERNRYDQEHSLPPRSPLVLNRVHAFPEAGHLGNETAHAPAARSAPTAVSSVPDHAAAPPIGDLPGASALQVHNRYLITECEEGIVVIDQHALHERIIYEQLREKVLGGALESQTLLVPEPVDFTPEEAALALEHSELLARLGIAVAPFGGDTILVSSYPAMLANLPPAAVLRGVVDQLLERGKQPDRRDLLDELLHMISCKAAIKAGDRLTSPEIQALLQQRHLAQDAHHCPHGRPTSLVFTRSELDRMFKRT